MLFIYSNDTKITNVTQLVRWLVRYSIWLLKK